MNMLLCTGDSVILPGVFCLSLYCIPLHFGIGNNTAVLCCAVGVVIESFRHGDHCIVVDMGTEIPGILHSLPRLLRISALVKIVQAEKVPPLLTGSPADLLVSFLVVSVAGKRDLFLFRRNIIITPSSRKKRLYDLRNVSIVLK